jgi:4-hydroxybenzoate polyprenyltransferase
MRAKTLYWIGRWGAIQSWSGSGVILGVAAAIYELGFASIDWGLVAIAALGVVLVHYVSHALNDLTDYEIDAKTNIEGTGRHKILLAGDVTKKELTWLSIGLIALVTAMAVYVGYRLPLALLFVGVGYFGMLGYNSKPLKLAYKPLNEIVVDIPVNMAMVVGVAYVATSQLIGLAIVMGVFQTFMGMSMKVTYAAMDSGTDRHLGKVTSSVRFPQFPWSTIYPACGLFSVVAFLLLRVNPLLLIVPAALFALQTWYAMKVDWLRNDFLLKQGVVRRRNFFHSLVRGIPSSTTDTWEGTSHAMSKLLVKQLVVTIVNGILLGAVLIALA